MPTCVAAREPAGAWAVRSPLGPGKQTGEASLSQEHFRPPRRQELVGTSPGWARRDSRGLQKGPEPQRKEEERKRSLVFSKLCFWLRGLGFLSEHFEGREMTKQGSLLTPLRAGAWP